MLLSNRASSNPSFSTRKIAAVLAIALMGTVAACSGPSPQLATEWEQSGERSDQIDHNAWDELLSSYAVMGDEDIVLVDYAAIEDGGKDALDSYIASLEQVEISEYPRDEQFAYWVNLYNAATVQVIVENYPLDSIRDIGLLGQGPWKDKSITVEGRELSLDDIEHAILRPIWQDVRIHYAVNCASIGCPNLALKAYRSDLLEEMLDEAAVAYVNHRRGFAERDGELIASNIYDWYQSDWGTEQDVLAHAREYANEETAELLQDAEYIDGYDYDWSLNDSQ